MLSYLIGILTIFLPLAACQEEEFSGGEPAVYYDFFRMRDSSTKDDLFINNSDLSPEDVKLYIKGESDRWIERELTYTDLDDHTVFGPVTFINDYDLYRLELSVSDIDTIRVEATDDADYDDVFRFYYNSTLADEYDFTDEEFLYSYIETNAASSRGEPRALPDGNTYIITFEKVVEE